MTSLFGWVPVTRFKDMINWDLMLIFGFRTFGIAVIKKRRNDRPRPGEPRYMVIKR